MTVLSSLPIFLSGNIITYVFLLMFAFGLFFKLIGKGSTR